MARRPAGRSPKPRRGTPPARESRRLPGLAIAAAVVLAVMVAVGAWSAFPRPAIRPADAAWIEAREALRAGHASDAERALALASRFDPSDPEPWLLRLEILRVEDRQVEALRVGWAAYEAVPAAARRPVLRALTLALLADTPEDVGRSTLARWVAADPSDLDARVALFQRIAANPRAGDPDRPSRIASLSKILEEHPDHVAAREAMTQSLAEAGDPNRGRLVLDGWPASGRDARYFRLLGRWNLEYPPHDFARAVRSLERALEELPHDWRTRYRLARALRNAGRPVAADRAAEAVEKLREGLDPATLGQRLDADLGKLDDPASRLDLADLCARVGLERLAEAWSRDARITRSPIRLPP